MMLISTQFVLGSLFLILIFLSVVMSAYPLTSKIKHDLNDLERITLSAILGLVVFTLCAYLLSWMHLRFLMYLFPVAGLINLFKFRKEILKSKLNIVHKKLFALVFIVGVIAMVAVNAPSGWPYKDGIYFWSSHGHDGIWHLALMDQMKKSEFPFQNPELAGNKLQNYHFFSDLFMSEFSRLFYFSPLDIYFRFMPVFFAGLLGFSSFIFVKNWANKESSGIWAMIYTFFAGSFGYLLYVPTHNSLGGESIFWVSQTQSVLGNPPHAAAFIITTGFLFTLFKYLKNKNLFYFLLCILFGGAVIEFKVYAGVLLIFGLLCIGVFDLLLKKSFKLLILFFSTLSLAFAIYFPNSANSQDFLKWQPWWFIRTMVVATDRLNWLDLELRRQTYIADHNIKRVIQVELTAFLIFLFGNLGMRFVGFYSVFKQIKSNIFSDYFNLFFLIVTFTSFFIPVFFLQKGVAWNSIQFNQYFLLFFGFLAAMSAGDFISALKYPALKFIVSAIIITLAVPTQLGLLWQFYSNSALSKISYPEIEALNFLKKQNSGIVLTAPFNRYERDKYKTPPIPIYSWYDTGYVSAFSSKQTLISDEEQVNIMGYQVDDLLRERKQAFESLDSINMNNFLKKYNIDYVYLAWDQGIATDSAYLNMDPIFESENAKIFKVRK